MFEEDKEQPIVSLTPSEQVDREIKAYLEKPCIDYEGDPYSGGTVIRMSFLLLLHWRKNICVFVELAFHLNVFSVKVDT